MKGGLYYSAAALALIGSTPLAAAATQQQLAQQNIKHVVIIMQENRSFDHYFGTFPGADGIPAGTCVPIDPANPSAGCVQPYPTTSVNQSGAPHSDRSEVADVDNGRMDGFVAQQIQAFNAALARGRCTQPPNPQRPNPKCDGYYNHDVMSYYTAATLPNYWAYAQNFMLEDHLFEPSAGASLQAHLMMTSEWQAVCAQVTDPMSCTTTVVPVLPTAFNPTPYAWTNLTWLLNRAGVSWRYYLEFGAIPDCVSGFDDCAPGTQTTGTPSLWNPLPAFTTCDAACKANVVDANQFYLDINGGHFPSVAWITPNQTNSEHPDSSTADGMHYVTAIVNTIMQSPYWSSTVIFIGWDDWGGFYDHVVPPRADSIGYGIRVPGLIISPWVLQGIDHQYVSFDAYNRFVEDVFLGSARLDPSTDGRPDTRPVVREALQTLTDPNSGASIPVGDLLNDFTFTRAPLPPLVLPDE